MNKKKALLFGMLLSFAVMVALIVVMLIVTDGKELSEFSNKERQYFVFFVIAEVTACISMLVCAFFTGRLNAENMPKAVPVTRSRQEKVLRRRNILIYIFSALAALFFYIAGIWIRTRAGASGLRTAAVFNVILCILPLLSLILSVILGKRESSRLEKIKLEDMEKLLLSQRSEAEARYRESLKKLHKLRLLIMGFTILLLLIAAGIAFLGGWGGKGTEGLSFDLSTLELLYATGLFAAAISRIPRKIPTAFIEEDPTFLPAKEYPYLYGMAEKTAKTLGLHAPVRIAVSPDDETGISDLDSVMILKLSLRLVSVLSEQEMQALMYHEFSHVAQKTYTQEDAYANWFTAGRAEEDTIGALFANFLYGYPDLLYGFQHFIYNYSVSLLRESDADQAMIRFCSREAAASVLLKTYYTDRYDYELWITDSINEYEQERPVPGILKRQIDAFQSCMRERAGIWDEMMKREILSRTATHPTVRMRLEALGITEACALPVSGSAPYLNEVHDAAERLDRLIYEKMQENYPEARKEYYLDPLERIRTFEDAGRPLEDYWEVCEALQTYGRRN